MAYTITDEKTSIKIYDGQKYTSIQKSNMMVESHGNNVRIYQNGKEVYRFDYTEVSSPTVASAEAVRAALVAMLESGNSFINIAGAATTLVKTGAGQLIGIVINKLVATGVVTIYDNTSAAGTKIATITNPAALLSSQVSLDYKGVSFSTGLTIVTSSTDDITVIYK